MRCLGPNGRWGSRSSAQGRPEPIAGPTDMGVFVSNDPSAHQSRRRLRLLLSRTAPPFWGIFLAESPGRWLARREKVIDLSPSAPAPTPPVCALEKRRAPTPDPRLLPPSQPPEAAPANLCHRDAPERDMAPAPKPA